MKKETESASIEYSVLIGLLAIVFYVSKGLEDPTNVIVLKLAVMPLIYLSFLCLQLLFKQPIIESRVTVRAVEYCALQSLLYALSGFLIFWDPESTAQDLALGFAAIMLFRIGVLIWEVKRQSHRRYEAR